MWTITRRRLRRNRRGISNIIVVALSLVIILAIVSNLVLWNYEMNQVDWEKMKESISITNVEDGICSSWFVVQNEYTVTSGIRTNGDYTATQAIDSSYESFSETDSGGSVYSLDLNGPFVIDLGTYPPEDIKSVEIHLRFRADDSAENWILKAYNWVTSTYSNIGFNSTEGYTPTMGWDYYVVEITDGWQNYIQGDGTIVVKLVDEGADSRQTALTIDFLGIRVRTYGTQCSFKNVSGLTVHLVSLWITNSTDHQRYDISIYVNSAETEIYIRDDISLPVGGYTVKVVTERGNTAVYSGN